jgi:acetyl-CoA acetyltransferase
VAPLRAHDWGPATDAAAAIVLAAGERARALCPRPAFVAGIDHRVEPHALGVRDLTRSVSTEIAARAAGVPGRRIDVAELCAPFCHEELILRDALGLAAPTAINPSGGALKAHPLMVAGLMRLGEAAQRVLDGEADTALGHASAGPCLQQNLVCLLEARP